MILYVFHMLLHDFHMILYGFYMISAPPGESVVTSESHAYICSHIDAYIRSQMPTFVLILTGLMWIKMFLICYRVFWPSTTKNHIKNNDSWWTLPNWIHFQLLLKKFQKIFSAIFGPFSLTSYFFELSISKFVLKRLIFIQHKNSRSLFFASKLLFFSPIPTTHFFQFCGFLDLCNSVSMRPGSHILTFALL